MLPLHDVALDDVERPRRRAKNCHALVQNLILTLQILIVFASSRPSISKTRDNIYRYQYNNPIICMISVLAYVYEEKNVCKIKKLLQFKHR